VISISGPLYHLRETASIRAADETSVSAGKHSFQVHASVIVSVLVPLIAERHSEAGSAWPIPCGTTRPARSSAIP
jgi:hypothetical protein